MNNKLVWVILAGILCANIFLFGFYKIVVRGATNAVIERLQKPYSPSPYAPGFDPDKVSPDALRPQTQGQEVKFRDQWEAMRE